MEEENKPSDTNPSEPELSSEEGNENVSKDTSDEGIDIKKINEITGRNFKDAEDFKKHYDNLVSFSGTEEAKEIRAKAKAYEDIQKEAGKVDGELDINDRISALQNSYEKSEFLRKNPEAEEHLSLVEAAADHNKCSYKEAWDKYVKDYGVLKTEKDKEKSVSIESNSKVAPEKTRKIAELAEIVRKTDNTSAKEALVKEALGL